MAHRQEAHGTPMRGAMRDDGVEICADAMNASMKRQHAREMENTMKRCTDMPNQIPPHNGRLALIRGDRLAAQKRARCNTLHHAQTYST